MISNYVTAFMISLSPNASTERLNRIAVDIVRVAESDPVVDGDTTKTALLLAAIAFRESGFRPEVETCKVRGDHGAALGLWQTHSTEAVCRSRITAVRVALDYVRRSLSVCQGLDPDDRLGVYTHGHCVRNNWWSRDRFGLVRNWQDTHPLTEFDR